MQKRVSGNRLLENQNTQNRKNEKTRAGNMNILKILNMESVPTSPTEVRSEVWGWGGREKESSAGQKGKGIR